MMGNARRNEFNTVGRVAACFAVFQFVSIAAAEDRERVNQPNYQQAMQYNSQYLRQFVYDTSVRPQWIGKTDLFWYEFRTSTGKYFWRVNPKLGTKEPLFDRVKLGALLSEAVQKPLDAALLPLQRITINDEGTKLKFVVDDLQFEYELLTEKLTKLGKAPPAPPTGFPGGAGGQLTREEFERRREEFQRQREDQQRQQEEQRQDQDQQQRQQQEQQQDDQQREQRQDQQQQDDQQNQQRTGRGGPPGTGSRFGDYRNFSPDRSMYLFAKNHNLYLVELKKEEPKKEEPKKDADKPDDAKTDDLAKKTDDKQTGEKKDEGKKDEGKKEETKKDDAKSETKSEEKKSDEKKEDAKKEDGKKEDAKKDEVKSESKGEEKKSDEKQSEKPASPQQGEGRRGGPPESAGQENQLPIPRLDPKQDDTAIQLTTDGVEDYSFAGGFGGFGRGGEGGTGQTTTTIPPDRKSRPNVTWSKDSKSFYVTRNDSRGVQELWVINSLANPRPTLEKYKYPMPGDPAIRKSELYVFTRDSKKLTRVTPKWKDENYQNLHYGKSGGDELRFLRRDRLLRHIEFCSLNVATGESKCLLTEGFENANILTTQYRYLDDTDEMIWWSERSGWGHFYLYDRSGTLKNPITAGPFRADRIVDVDAKNRMLYFTATGREPNENIYYEHLYCVRLDGTGLALMDPGNANHRSTLSPTKQFMVDNCSRTDMAPKAILREASGKEVITLEEADLSRLRDAGWRMPETFVVKAADGVTDLYGNIWKPFDFDASKKYPIIANVYPGPQMEGTTHTFSASSGTQQLAQIGFVVIQVGHRGGAPNRSKAYASFGYFNLRDYGLEDKKYAIEQLAARHAYIDLNRVGLYGHSGGGFMTAAALLQKPYNEFFKVGVSTSGNHDNNIYNNSWSERYHGLKEVAVVDEKSQTGQTTQAGQSGAGGTRGGTQFRRGTGGQQQQQQQQRSGEGAFDLFQTEDDDLFDESAFEELLALINPEWTPPPHLAAQWGVPSSHHTPRDADFVSRSETPMVQQEGQDKKDETKNVEVKKEDGEKKADDKKTDETKSGDTKSEGTKTDEKKSDDKKESTDEKKSEEKKADEKKTEEKKAEEKKTKFEIKVPTNQELAANLKGHLLLVHGEIDNNVHPANTMRLVDALIKANKRFDMLMIPGKRHGYADAQPYVTQRTWEYFAEHLMGDKQTAVDIYEKSDPRSTRK